MTGHNRCRKRKAGSAKNDRLHARRLCSRGPNRDRQTGENREYSGENVVGSERLLERNIGGVNEYDRIGDYKQEVSQRQSASAPANDSPPGFPQFVATLFLISSDNREEHNPADGDALKTQCCRS